MAKSKYYKYIVEGINSIEKANQLKAALKIVPHIKSITINRNEFIVMINSKKNPEKDISMACKILNLKLRTVVK